MYHNKSFDSCFDEKREIQRSSPVPLGIGSVDCKIHQGTVVHTPSISVELRFIDLI